MSLFASLVPMVLSRSLLLVSIAFYVSYNLNRLFVCCLFVCLFCFTLNVYKDVLAVSFAILHTFVKSCKRNSKRI